MTAQNKSYCPDRLRRLATYASLTVALVLIAAKLGAYLLTNSVALLSSLIDSTVDLLASGVTLLGVASALKPPDHDHRYGHGKAEPLAALAQAAFIIGSSVLLTYEAMGHFLHPRPPEHTVIGYAVMALAIVLTGFLVVFQRYVVNKTGSVAIGADSLHYRGDLFLNLAVILSFALGEWTGSGIFDPIFAIAIAALLIHGAWKITRHAIDAIMDRELPDDVRAQIRVVALGHPRAQGIHDLRTRSDGDRKFIEFHLELDPNMTLGEAHDITDEVEMRVKQAFPGAEVIIHQEPAGVMDDRLDHRIGQA